MKKIASAPPQEAAFNGNYDNIKASYMVGVQSRFRRKYYHKTIFAIFSVIILLLIIVIIIISCFLKSSRDDICYSPDCLRTSATFIQNMDLTVNPCEDFFKYMCGNFDSEHPLPDTSTSHDWFTEKQLKVLRVIRKKLQQKTQNDDSEPFPVSQAKFFYKSCIDTSANDKLEFQPLFRYLKQFNLPKIPTLLKNSESDVIDFEFDWVKTIVKIKRSLGADKIIGFEIFPDPKNRSVNYLAIGSPSQESELPIVDDALSKRIKHMRKKYYINARIKENNDDEGSEEEDEEEDVALLAYNLYMKEVIMELIKKAEPTYQITDNLNRISRLMQVSINISKSIYTFIEMAENASKVEDRDGNLSDLVYIKLKDLQKKVFDELSIEEQRVPLFEKYMILILDGIPEAHFDIDEDVVLTSNADIMYLKNAMQLINDTKSIYLEAFLWWSVVEELILYTTSSMRSLYYDYTKTITGVEGIQSRSSYCTMSINKLMGYAVSYLIVEKNFMKDTKPNVEEMLSNIQKSFANIIYNSWMDFETKKRSLTKLQKMKSLIGFPEWILNKTELELHYKGYQVNNAFDTDSRLISILISEIFFLTLRALNYGSIGTVLAHELTHGFDDIGRHFDDEGNKNFWWTNKTIEEFLNRTECFKKQYSEFYLSEINEYINGDNTLGENIADNGGIREAFYGYNYFIKTSGKEKKLPGFEDFTHEQLFFMSYGNLWCETMSIQGLKFSLEDTHCPGRIRLLGVLSNTKEFSNAFKCHLGHKYYKTDDQKCILWNLYRVEFPLRIMASREQLEPRASKILKTKEDQALFNQYMSLTDKEIHIHTLIEMKKLNEGITSLQQTFSSIGSISFQKSFIETTNSKDSSNKRSRNPILKTEKSQMEGTKLQKSISSGVIVEGRANFFPINFHENIQLIQYRVDFEPEVDATLLKKKILTKNEDLLNLSPRYVFDGSSLYTQSNVNSEVDTTFHMNPNSTFRLANGKEMTYVDYYMSKYGIKINDRQQFLLVSRARERDIRAGKPEMIYLIPELSRATGNSKFYLFELFIQFYLF
ncbi:hypothetical protein PVAND_002598 [Polypedilum vanderplanki]|uniref:PAZ domain-containing protein n=1 Tax=Polypedilum vanderplanki TaxID=319348 RepID=A0A9J6BRN2_POLVA|nr:hypothetical protein PVAND_002598 [Polypedilum vanderplanki]